MKRPVLTPADRQIMTAEARRFSDWIAAMLVITLSSHGAKSRLYRQTLRLSRVLTEWRAALEVSAGEN